ncbi:MAG: FHA domain-containing protein [Rhodopirellula sp. JB055]|uniref:FHA domain-containing protein n=1 Tax=Rhodopirellula sp. JB055 TaxID=3342846 RepID=UPI00370CF8BD
MPESSVQLILASGSRAGLVAEIRTGYYMIGRDRGCQIRPTHRSVSRKHCLLHWEAPVNSEPRFRIFDLNSTTGTRVNGIRIPTRTWVELIDGAELRCGKITFALSIQAGETADSQCSLNDTAELTCVLDEDSPANNSMLEGDAWQEIDLGSILQPGPLLDPESGQDDIRAKASNRDARGSDSENPDSDDDISEDEAADDSDQSSSSINAAPKMADSRNSNAQAEDGLDSKDEPEKKLNAEKPTDTKKSPSLKPTDSTISKFVDRVDWNQVKIYAVLAMTVAVFVLGGYQVLQFWQGPEAQIVDGID